MTKPIEPTSPPNPEDPHGAHGGSGGASASTAPQAASGAAGVHAMRRGGARREVTERVTLKGVAPGDGRSLDGWALNVSRGGLRAILEDKVELGERFEVTLGDGELLVRIGRIVWVQEEPDGVIVGLEFASPPSGTVKSVPPAPPGVAAVASRDPQDD